VVEEKWIRLTTPQFRLKKDLKEKIIFVNIYIFCFAGWKKRELLNLNSRHGAI